MAVCFCFCDEAPEAAWTGVKVVQLGIWLWAGVSKWGAHFPFVVQTMLCNSMTWPFTSKALHRRLCRAHPTDLRASRLCEALAHGGTLLEAVFPLLLACGGAAGAGYLLEGGAAAGRAGLALAVAFHAFIFTQVKRTTAHLNHAKSKPPLI